MNIVGALKIAHKNRLRCKEKLAVQKRQKTREHMTQSTRHGFTLIELIVVVAIAAILAAIAIPSYTNYVVRGNRKAAQSTMMDIAQKEQQYLLDARSYGDLSATGLNYTVPSGVSSLYTVTATPVAGPPPGFTIKAVPIAGTSQANDPTLTLDNTGLKTPASVW